MANKPPKPSPLPPAKSAVKLHIEKWKKKKLEEGEAFPSLSHEIFLLPRLLPVTTAAAIWLMSKRKNLVRTHDGRTASAAAADKDGNAKPIQANLWQKEDTLQSCRQSLRTEKSLPCKKHHWTVTVRFVYATAASALAKLS